MLENMIRCQESIDSMQFGFMPGKGTTDAIFIMRQLQEKHKAKKKKLYYAFVDLKKAFDRVSIEVVRWDLRKLSVDEWLIRTVMAFYTEACTVVIMEPTMEQLVDVWLNGEPTLLTKGLKVNAGKSKVMVGCCCMPFSTILVGNPGSPGLESSVRVSS